MNDCFDLYSKVGTEGSRSHRGVQLNAGRRRWLGHLVRVGNYSCLPQQCVRKLEPSPRAVTAQPSDLATNLGLTSTSRRARKVRSVAALGCFRTAKVALDLGPGGS